MVLSGNIKSGVKIFNVTGSLVALNGATTKTLSYSGETIYNTWECVYEYNDANTSLKIQNGAMVVNAKYQYAIARVYKIPSEVTSKNIIGCTMTYIRVDSGSYGVTSWDGSSTENKSIISLVNGSVYPSYTLTVANNSSKSTNIALPNKSYNIGLNYFTLLSAFSGTTATTIRNTTGLTSVAPTHLMMRVYGGNPYDLGGLSSIHFNYLG